MHGILFTRTFERQAEREGLSDEEVLDIASSIAADPLLGDLISGTGGARKVRHAGRGHGKSGGYRTIHYFGGDDAPLFLLAIYGKGAKANLNMGEKNQLAAVLPKIAAAYKARTN